MQEIDIEQEWKELAETQTGSTEIYNGAILHVVKDQVKLPNGKVTGREVVRHVGAVCIVPVLEDGRVIVERQFRYPIFRVITEVPAGKLDSPKEDRLAAARRELKEETGYVADKWVDMGDFYPAAAYCDEKITMFLATGLHKEDQNLDDDEFLMVQAVPMAVLVDQILMGEITDAKTQASILKAAMFLDRGLAHK